jgi:hypothetical protein
MKKMATNPKASAKPAKAAPKVSSNVQSARNLLESVIQTGDEEIIDLLCDHLGVVSSQLIRLAEAKAGAEQAEAEDEDEDMEDEDADDADESEDDEEVEDEDESDEDEDFEEDEAEEEDDEEAEEDDDDGEEESDEDDDENFDEDEEDEDADEDEESDEEESEDDEDEDGDEDPFAEMPLAELRAYMKDLGIETKAVLGKIDATDKEALQEQLAKVARDMAGHFDELSGKSQAALNKIAKAEGIEVELGRLRKPDAILEKYAEVIAISRAVSENATKKAKTSAAPAKKVGKISVAKRRN